MPLQFDASTKHLVETRLADWLPWSGRPLAPAVVIDAELSSVTAACDKLLRVDAAPPWLLHLEMQASWEADLAQRVHLYNTLAETRHGELVQSLLVLLRREANNPRLTGVHEVGFPGEEPYRVFRYKVVRLWQEPVERLLTGGLGMVALAPLSDEAAPQLEVVFRRMEERFQAGAEPAEVNELWTASSILTGLRYDRAVTAALIQRVRGMRESSTYQLILEEGRAEGLQRGALEHARRLLLRLGTRKFGAPDEAATAAVNALTDLEHLDRLAERVADVSSWAELLAAPETGSSPG